MIDRAKADRPWRQWLDVLATIVIIVAGGFTILGSMRRVPDTGRVPQNRPTIQIPKEPVSFEGAPVKGNAGAPIAIIEFSDFECPFCGRFAREILPGLEETYIQKGNVQLAFRHLPLPIHSNAARAAEASECAAQQFKFWPMHDELFASSAILDEVSLAGRAVAVGVSVPAYTTCMQGLAKNRVDADSALARTLGVTGTPTFFIGRTQPNKKVLVEQVVTGARPLADFKAALDRLLGKA